MKKNPDGTVTVKITETTVITGKGFVKAGEVHTVSPSDAAILIHYEKAEPHTAKK